MAKQLVYRGGAPNDGQGDSLYNAFKKVNENFNELYSSFGTFSSNNVTVANNMLFGNSTVNAIVNSSVLIINGSDTITIAPSSVTLGNTTLLTSSLNVGNSTSNAQVNSISIKIGTAITNTTVNSSIIQVANTLSGNTRLLPGQLVVGNSTVNAVVNSTVITVNTAVVGSNTLTLGSSTIAANGHSRLPNGLLYQWGKVSANSTSTKIDFSTTFATLYSITVTPKNATYDSSYFTMVVGSNTSSANVKTSNATSIDVYYTAIGV